MSANLLVVNADGPETRVALIEKGVLSELFIERKKERGIVGNIYKGVVVRVLPGMQAAFVDIGLEKAAFLHVSDLAGPDLVRAIVEEPDDEESVDVEVTQPRRRVQFAPIEEPLLQRPGVLVQVSKG